LADVLQPARAQASLARTIPQLDGTKVPQVGEHPPGFCVWRRDNDAILQMHIDRCIDSPGENNDP
jgi:hypothetical protein